MTASIPNLRGGELLPADFEKLAKSGISRELAEQAMLRRVESHEGAEIVGRNGFRGDYAGVLFPYTWPSESGIRDYRLRRDKPELEPKPEGGFSERGKYLSPPGRGNMLYLVPGTDACWLTDATMPAIVVEGEKKTLALHSLSWHELGDGAERPRWLSIGLAGVYSWLGTTGKTAGPDGTRRDVKGPIADLHRITWKRRSVTVLFDRNVDSNERVRSARQKLTEELQRRGCEVFWFHWPDDTPESVNGIDDLLGLWGAEKVLETIKSQARAVRITNRDIESAKREFSAIGEGRYRLELPSAGITFEVDRLRRERNELVGELSVKCNLPGARTVEGTLSAVDFNFSSARSRSERAKLLSDRSRAQLDWDGLVEEFCQRVLQADRNGQPAVDLRTLPKPQAGDDIEIEGLYFPRRHPTLLFGDGGSGKSYVGLWIAGCLAKRGIRIGLFDWELAGEDHRERLEMLFGSQMPRIFYARCERPLVYEADRLRRIVQDNAIDYAVFDSVAFACDGPPETAEIAGRYFRALRQIGIGSLNIAHVTKTSNDAKAPKTDQKPFGSIFWHNGARATWFVQKADDSMDADVLKLGFFNRKTNLTRMRQPVGLDISFAENRVLFNRGSVTENPDLASHMSIRQRMAHLLKRGAMSPAAIAEEIEASEETVKRTARRYRDNFIVLDGGKFGLRERYVS